MGIKALTATGIILGSLLAHSFADSGRWDERKSISPMDDSPTVVLSLESSDRIGSGFKSERPTLVIRCQENQTTAYINWQTFISVTDTEITTRIDSDLAQSSLWSVSSNYKATLSPKSIPFIKSMLNKESLIVRVTPFNDNSYTVKFDITGLDNAIKPVRETCGW